MDSVALGKTLTDSGGAGGATALWSVSQHITNGVLSADSNSLILNSFQFTQNGREIQIQDEDGSVYSGQIVSNATVGQPVLAGGKLAATSRASTAQPAPGEAKALAEPEANQNVYFRVAGTNPSLKQKVEIEAYYANDPRAAFGAVASANATSNNSLGVGSTYYYQTAVGNQVLPARAGQSRLDNNASSNRLLFQNSLSPRNYRAPQNPTLNYQNNNQRPTDQKPPLRLQGQAIIGGTNQVSIDAYPSAP